MVNYQEWLPLPKKDENVRMSVDYRDLNKAGLNDDFHLSNVEALLTILLVMLCYLL